MLQVVLKTPSTHTHPPSFLLKAKRVTPALIFKKNTKLYIDGSRADKVSDVNTLVDSKKLVLFEWWS